VPDAVPGLGRPSRPRRVRRAAGRPAGPPASRPPGGRRRTGGCPRSVRPRRRPLCLSGPSSPSPSRDHGRWAVPRRMRGSRSAPAAGGGAPDVRHGRAGMRPVAATGRDAAGRGNAAAGSGGAVAGGRRRRHPTSGAGGAAESHAGSRLRCPGALPARSRRAIRIGGDLGCTAVRRGAAVPGELASFADGDRVVSAVVSIPRRTDGRGPRRRLQRRQRATTAGISRYGRESGRTRGRNRVIDVEPPNEVRATRRYGNPCRAGTGLRRPSCAGTCSGNRG
jgi:hypothetical protein